MEPRASWDLKMDTSQLLRELEVADHNAITAINTQKDPDGKLTKQVNNALVNLWNLRLVLLDINDLSQKSLENRSELEKKQIEAAAADFLYYTQAIMNSPAQRYLTENDKAIVPALKTYVEHLYDDDSGRTPNRSYYPEPMLKVRDLQFRCVEILTALKGQSDTIVKEINESKDKDVLANKNAKLNVLVSAAKDVRDVLQTSGINRDEAAMVEAVSALCDRLQEHLDESKNIAHVGMGNKLKSIFGEAPSKTTTLLEKFVQDTRAALASMDNRQESKPSSTR